jgi:hypothetical protein
VTFVEDAADHPVGWEGRPPEEVKSAGQMVNGQALYTVMVRAAAVEARARERATDFILLQLREVH